MNQMYPDYTVSTPDGSAQINHITAVEKDGPPPAKKQRYSWHGKSERQSVHERQNTDESSTTDLDIDESFIKSSFNQSYQSSESQIFQTRIADSIKLIQNSAFNFEKACTSEVKSLQNELKKTQEAIVKCQTQKNILSARLHTVTSEMNSEISDIKILLAKTKHEKEKEIVELKNRLQAENDWCKERREMIEKKHRHEALMDVARKYIEKMKNEYNEKVKELNAKIEAITNENNAIKLELQNQTKTQ